MSENSGILYQTLDIHGNSKSAIQLQIGGGFRFITHNFCDATTWWHESSEHTDQATTSGDQLTYTITGHTNLIDIRHKKLTFENEVNASSISPVNGNVMTNIIPTVLVDATPLSQSNEVDTPTTGDEYSIDYANGTITFGVARGGGEVITISFRKSAGSKYMIKPDANKKIIIEDVELDLTEDIDMVDTVQTIVEGSHSIQTGGARVTVQTKNYVTFHDFQAAARRFWGPIPNGFGGTGGAASPKWTFEWQYARSDIFFYTDNYVDLNLDPNEITLNTISVKSKNDLEIGGSFLTVTFYGQTLAESA